MDDSPQTYYPDGHTVTWSFKSRFAVATCQCSAPPESPCWYHQGTLMNECDATYNFNVNSDMDECYEGPDTPLRDGAIIVTMRVVDAADDWVDYSWHYKEG
jgi:hypothetical protein